MNKRNAFLLFTAGFCSSLLMVAIYAFSSKAEETIPLNADNPAALVAQKVTAIQGIREDREIDFAGESVPLKMYDVRERLDRELLVNTYWHSNTILSLKLANKYFPEIEPILKRNGIPDDFKFLCMAESGMRNVVSPSQAVGFWQLLKETGIRYGCEVNEEVDERYDVAKSTQAACNYLNEAYRTFGSWTMAAASYNMGIAGLGAQAKFQKQSNYYDLLLNEETARYVFRILALKEIYNNRQNYGFYLESEDLYEPQTYQIVELDSSVSNLANYSLQWGTNYKNLKLMNPWLRKNSIKVAEGKSYDIRIPWKQN